MAWPPLSGGGTWRYFTSRNGLPSDEVNCLLEDSGGLLWIGTGEGLARLGPDGLRVSEGLPPHEGILGLAEDRQGWLWIATSKRVLRARRDELLGAGGPAPLVEYRVADGLFSTEATRRHRSVVADLLGRIWFSMSRGLSVVDPGRATSSAAPLVARIEAMTADGNPLDLEGARRIPPAPRRVTFSYSG
jgi:ligand-binding sensor domain-containing protein